MQKYFQPNAAAFGLQKPFFNHFKINYKLSVSFCLCINHLPHLIGRFDSKIIVKNEKLNFMTSFICKNGFTWFDLLHNITVLFKIEFRFIITNNLKLSILIASISMLDQDDIRPFIS